MYFLRFKKRTNQKLVKVANRGRKELGRRTGMKEKSKLL